MDLDTFEAQSRAALAEALDQLQTVTLKIAALEIQVSEIAQTVHQLSDLVETYTTAQRCSSEIEEPES